MPGYQLRYNNRNLCKGDGVAAYIEDSVVYKRCKDIESLQPEFDQQWLEFPANRNRILLTWFVLPLYSDYG